WQTTFTNEDPNAFYDCMGFFDRQHGLAVSDPVDGKFRVISTSDGGRHWAVMPTAGMPKALDGEFGFAASGTCLVTSGHRDAWIGSGGAANGRVFHTANRGRSWVVRSTPIAGGPSAGIFSLAFRGTHDGVAVGGDFATPAAAVDAAGWTTDGVGKWQLSRSMPGGYRSGAAWVPGSRATVIAVGPTGSDVSRDAGRTWTGFDTASYDVVQCAAGGGCWASGDAGAVAKLVRGQASASDS
ncbi:MAG: oxidoreductase, partial [Actinomycetota bacterium]|nr:oxidoreductase [Actinomycetota bacterium]